MVVCGVLHNTTYLRTYTAAFVVVVVVVLCKNIQIFFMMV